jgi:hypothetical protein
VKRHLDAKQPGQSLFKLADPAATMFEVLAGDRIVATEKCSANTARPTVIHTDFTVSHDFPTRT